MSDLHMLIHKKKKRKMFQFDFLIDSNLILLSNDLFLIHSNCRNVRKQFASSFYGWISSDAMGQWEESVSAKVRFASDAAHPSFVEYIPRLFLSIHLTLNIFYKEFFIKYLNNLIIHKRKRIIFLRER